MEEKPLLYDDKNSQNIIINVASDEEYSVMQIVEKMYSLAGKNFNPNIKIDNIKIADTIDVSKLKEVFDFQFSYDLEKGLCEVMEIDKKQKVLRRK